MLDALRKGAATWVAKILIGLLVISFAVWGVADIFGGYGASTVATVGDQEISSQDYQSEFQRELRTLGNRLGRNLTADEARSMGLDSQVLLRLIGDAAIESQAKDLGLGVTGKAVTAGLMREKTFHDSNGKFSRERFYRILQANGLNEQAFLERQRRGAVMEQITKTVTSSGQVSSTLLNAANRFRNETRKLKYITVPLSQLGEVEQASAEKIRDYYNTHKSEFRAPEFRKAGIIALTPGEVAKGIEVSEDEIVADFEKNKARYGQPERRNVQQISFPDKASASAAYEKLKQGADFMEVAKERGLSEKDVNLGLTAMSGLADERVAKAIFALPEGEISEPVEGTLATVIARVTKIEPAVVKTLEDERDNIRKAIAAGHAASAILDTYDKIEDERAGGATLAEVAKKHNLKYIEVPGVNRNGLGRDGEKVDFLSREARVLQAIFAAEVGLETDPEETSDRGYAWYEVLEVTPERVRPFEEAADEATKKQREAAERELLARKGQELVDKLRGGAKLIDIASEMGLETFESTEMKRGSKDNNIPSAALQQAFALKQGAYGSTASNDGKARVIFQVTEVNEPKSIDTKTREGMLKSVARDIGDDMIVQYVRALRGEFGVNINQKVFQEATTGRPYSGG